MSKRSDEFALRRKTLQLQCALQRVQFADSTARISATLHSVDRGLNLVSLVSSTKIIPMLLAGVSAAGMLTKAGGIIRLLSRIWVVVSTVQRLKRSRK